MEPVHVHVAILSVGSASARAGTTMENIVADALTAAGHQISAFESVKDSEVAIRSQLVGWIEDPDVDVVVVVGEGESTSKALAPLIEQPLPGFADLLRMLAFQEIGASAMLSTAEAAKCAGSTFVFVLPASEKAVGQAMEKLIIPQLDPKTLPRNLISQIPRLREEADVTRVDHAAGPADSIPTPIAQEKTAGGFGITRLPAKPAPNRVKSPTNKNMIVRPKVEDPTKPIELQKLEKQIELSKPTTQTKAMDLSKLPLIPPGADKHMVARIPPKTPARGSPVAPISLDELRFEAIPSEPKKSAVIVDDGDGVADDGPTIRDGGPTVVRKPPARQDPVHVAETVVGPAPSRPAPATVVGAPVSARAPASDTIVEGTPGAADQYRAEGVTTVRPKLTPVPVTPGSGPPKPPPRSPTPAAGAPVVKRMPTPAAPMPVVKPNVPPSTTPFVASRLGAIPGGTPERDSGSSIELLPSDLLRDSTSSIDGVPPLAKPPNVVSLKELESELGDRESAPTLDLSPRADEPKPDRSQGSPAMIMTAAPAATLESLIPPMPAGQERPRPPTPAPVKRPPTQPPPVRRPPTAPPADLGSLPVSAQIADLPQGSFDYKIKKRSKWPLLLLGLAAVAGIGFFVYRQMQSPDKRVAVTPDAQQVAQQTIDASAPDATEPVIEIDMDAAEPIDAADAKVSTPPRNPNNQNNPPRNPPTNPPANPPTNNPPPIDAAPGPDVPVAASADCDEVACVLEKYARPCCARFKPADSTFTPGAGDSLQKSQIKAGVDRVRGAIIQCGEKATAKGTVKVSVSVNGEGAVTDVSVVASPDDTLGSCVAGVMRKAQFAKTANGGSFTYPFVF